jgi:hypothetical protein
MGELCISAQFHESHFCGIHGPEYMMWRTPLPSLVRNFQYSILIDHFRMMRFLKTCHDAFSWFCPGASGPEVSVITLN